jgi:hypothetical protein
VGPIWYSLSLTHKRIQEGGWTHQVTQRELPSSKDIAGVNMRLTAGSFRELHWHTADEWAIMLDGNAELIVKTAITRGGLANPAIRAARIIPTDSVTVPETESVQPVGDLITEALHNRPDLAQAGIQVENSQISLKGSINALRPELDVVGTVQNGGLSGDINPVGAALTPGSALYPGGYGTALGQLFKNNFPTYSVGLQLTLPLRNRVAQADAVRDELQVRQAQVRRQQFEDQVRLEVADAYVAKMVL